MLKTEVADALTRICGPMTGQRVVDVGTGYGESANFFSKLKLDWTCYTVDGFGLYGDSRIYDRLDHDKVLQIQTLLGPNVIQILGNSSKIPWELPIDILFLDADHTYEGVEADFNRYAPFVVKGGIICFDDYNQTNNPDNGVQSFVLWALDGWPDRFKMIYEGFYCAIIEKL